MKKFFISFALFISVAGSVVHATTIRNADPVRGANTGTDKVNSLIQDAFKKEFTGACLIKWEYLKENIYLAQFLYNNERVNAYFDEAGRLVATGRLVNESSLPLSVQKNVAHKYASYELLQIIELTQNNETTYLLTLQNEQVTLDVRAHNSGYLTVIKKVKRNL